MPLVYDPEKEKTPEKTGSHDDLGVHPERREAEVDELERAYNADSAQTETRAEKKEAEGLAEQTGEDGGFFNDDTEPKSGRLRGKLNKKNVAIGGGAGVLVGGGIIAVFLLSSGPLQFVHLSQLFQGAFFGNQQDFMDGRTGRLLIHARNYSSGTAHRSNLGAGANKIADRYDNKLARAGIEAVYESPSGRSGRRIQAYNIDPETPEGKTALADLKQQGLDINDPNIASNIDVGDGKTVTRIHLRGSGSTKQSRVVTNTVLKNIKLNSVSEALAKRLLIHRAGVDFHPFRNKTYEKAQDIVDNHQKKRDFDQEVREERAERAKEGVDPPELRGGEDRVQDPDPENDSEAERATREAGTSVDDIKTASQDGPDAPGKLQVIKGSLVGKAATGAAAATAVVSLMCAAKDLGNQAEETQFQNNILPMMRMGMAAVTMGAQIASGNDVNFDELGVAADELYVDKEENPTLPDAERSAFSARPIQYESGNEPNGPDINPDAKPDSLEKKPAVFALLDSVPGLPTACAVDRWIGNLPVIKQVGDLSNRLASAATETVSGYSLVDIIGMVVDLIAGQSVDVYAEGAKRGAFMAYGAKLAAKDAAIATGASELDNTESLQLDQLRQERELADFQSKSLLTRLFDPYEPRSLVASTVLESPKLSSSSATATAALEMPMNSFANVFNNLSSLFTPKAKAQSTYDYGFNDSGFSVDEINNVNFDNPYDNAEWIETGNRLDDLNDKYGECFGTTVDDSGSIETQETNFLDLPSICQEDKNNEEMLNYRFYIADTVAMATLECYEGLDEGKCSELGFNNSIDSNSPSGGDGTEVIPIVGDTSHLTCEVGDDGGVVDGYSEGQLFKIRVCNVQGITVNAQIAKNTDNMITAAKGAGVNLTGGGFRTMAGQQEAYRKYQNGTGPTAAEPGYSNHQMGFAIDFDIVPGASDPTLDTCEANPANYPTYQWLAANAAGYGYYAKVRSECWHWSITGN